MMENKLLAVMGSPGSGKTTTAIKLAWALAAQKKNAVLVFCDPFAPVIPAVANVGMGHDISLGTLLTAPSLAQKQILDACVPIKESGHISLLGYREQENLMNYPKITKDRVLDFLVSLRYLADYIILDCTTAFEADPASIVAMEKADALLYMLTANLKGISYFQSHMSMLSGIHMQGENRRMAAGNVKVGQDWEALGALYGGSRYMLPFTPELEQQENELSLFSDFKDPASQPYQLVIERMVREVFCLETGKRASRKSALFAGPNRMPQAKIKIKPHPQIISKPCGEGDGKSSRKLIPEPARRADKRADESPSSKSIKKDRPEKGKRVLKLPQIRHKGEF